MKELTQNAKKAYDLLIKGKSLTEIYEYFKENGDKKISIHAHCKNAIYQMYTEMECYRYSHIIFARYNDLYSKSYERGDFKTCKEILDSICNLYALDESSDFAFRRGICSPMV